MKKFLLLAISLIFLASCGGKTVVVQGSDGRPAWTMKRGGAFTVNGRRVFRAVGISTNLDDEAMTIEEAETDARKNLSFVLKTYVKALHESYKRSIKSGDMPEPQFEQDVTHVSEVMTKSKFSGAQVVDTWIDPNSKTVYVLLELDLNAVNDMIKQVKGISQALIDTVGKRSEEAHERLNERLKEVGDF